MITDHKTETIKCMGPDPKSPHPLVYLAIKTNKTQCPYCGKIYKAETSPSTKPEEEKTS